jgi:hypothetical protein
MADMGVSSFCSGGEVPNATTFGQPGAAPDTTFVAGRGGKVRKSAPNERFCTAVQPNRRKAPDSVNGWYERRRELNAMRARRNTEETKRGSRAALHRICKIVSAKKIGALKSVRHLAGGRPPKKPAICQVLPSFA